MKALYLLPAFFLLSFKLIKPITYQTNDALSNLIIEGTSTLHDWEVEAENLKGSMKVDLYQDSVFIEYLSLKLSVKSLKSGNRAMDKNMYKALNENDYKEIHYQFISLNGIQKEKEGNLCLNTKGKLTVAGETRTLDIPITAYVKEEGIELKGETTFKMSDFKVEPPSFMFGTLTTGDQITIKFNINFNSTLIP